MAKIALALLAGGQARRMGGGDKGEILIDGQTIIASLLARFAPYSDYQCLNANGDLSRFAHYGLDVIPDRLEGYQGPLAGIYSCLEHIKQTKPEIEYLVSLPTDAPLVPSSLIACKRSSGIPHRPKPPAAINIPSNKSPSRASFADAYTFFTIVLPHSVLRFSPDA